MQNELRSSVGGCLARFVAARADHMQLRIEPLSQQHEPAARRFNARMRDGRAAVDFLLPETISIDPILSASAPVTKRYYIALEGEEIRANAFLQDQLAWIGGQRCRVWNIQSPLSEGIVNPAYNSAAIFLIRELLRRNPFIYSVGMGSEQMPYPRLLRALGWQVVSVSFFFRVRRAGRFMHNLQILRRDSLRRLVADFAAFSGLGAMVLHGYQAIKSNRAIPVVSYDRVKQFGEWADAVWEAAKEGVSFSIEHSAAVLNALLPVELEGLSRIRVSTDGTTVGWAALLISKFHLHPHFGEMRLATIVDAMSLPGKEKQVVAAALHSVSESEVDLIISNQSHKNWKAALGDSGFLSGPSNYLLGLSPKLAAAIPLAFSADRIHVNRADGDGISHL
jgi:hypothetical protein